MGAPTSRLRGAELERRPAPRRPRLVVARDFRATSTPATDSAVAQRLAALTVFVVGGVLIAAVTPGTGALGDVGSWWADPLTFGKVVVWALLWELLGLGHLATSAAGGLRHALRPGAIRLPPWPGRVLATSGCRRTVVDVALFVGVVVLGVAVLLVGPGGAGAPATLPRSWLWALLLCLAALGVRDRTQALAARPELYGVLLLVLMFPPGNVIFALKVCVAALWWRAAATRPMRETVPDALLTTTAAARAWTGLQFLAPLLLLVSRDDRLNALVIVITAALYVATTVPRAAPIAVPLPGAGGLLLLYATATLFLQHAQVGASSLDQPALVVVLIVALIAVPLLGAVRPDLVSARLSVRGDATSVWLFGGDGAEALFDERVAPHAAQGLAGRARLRPAREIDCLIGRAAEDTSAYTMRDGELVASLALGRSLGDAHLHGAQLLDAVQQRCTFAPGQLRVITVEARPLLRATRAFTVLDAAGGKLEAGTVAASDLIRRQQHGPGGNPVTVPIPVELSFQVLPVPRVIATRPRPRPARPTPAGTAVMPRPRPRPRPLASSEAR